MLYYLVFGVSDFNRLLKDPYEEDLVVSHEALFDFGFVFQRVAIEILDHSLLFAQELFEVVVLLHDDVVVDGLKNLLLKRPLDEPDRLRGLRSPVLWVDFLPFQKLLDLQFGFLGSAGPLDWTEGRTDEVLFNGIVSLQEPVLKGVFISDLQVQFFFEILQHTLRNVENF